MTIQKRNNSKGFPDVHTVIIPAGEGLTTQTYFCLNCKVYYDASGFAGTNFRNHLKNVHNCVDAD